MKLNWPLLLGIGITLTSPFAFAQGCEVLTVADLRKADIAAFDVEFIQEVTAKWNTESFFAIADYDFPSSDIACRIEFRLTAGDQAPTNEEARAHVGLRVPAQYFYFDDDPMGPKPMPETSSIGIRWDGLPDAQIAGADDISFVCSRPRSQGVMKLEDLAERMAKVIRFCKPVHSAQ
jgi:hypothetical protein